MLGRLLKHEFKQSSRTILMILAILVIITPVTALYTRFNMNRVPNTDMPFFDIFEAFQVVATILYVCAMIGAAAATIILLMYRFYKSMVTSEGYLTHTLPVKTSYIVVSKLIVNIVWQLISYTVIILSVIVFSRILGIWKFSDINFAGLIKGMHSIGINNSFIILTLICMFVSLITGVLKFFVSFAIGHRLNGHPFLGSIIAYIVISIIMQIISTIMGVLFSVFINSEIIMLETFSSMMNPLLIGSIIYQLILGAIFYIVTIWIFKNKLNI